jgi:threonine dehydrogenase-like Zn-dependent dehydrogenase
MRAYVVLGPFRGAVEEVAPPDAGPGQAVVAVERVGLCGTDVEFFTGEMAYLHQGHAAYPLRLGHEWSGSVVAVGAGSSDTDAAWLGRRVTGDTMLGCGRCARCTDGRQHVCADRFEIGIRGGWPGALAERLLVPASALHELPPTVDAMAGALVEPAANALRAVEAARPRPGRPLLVLGSGTIGLLAAQLALAGGAEVHVAGIDEASLGLARTLGVHGAWTTAEVPRLAYDAVIDATNDAGAPALALDLVEPGGRVVYIGLSGVPSTIDTRALALADVTAVGILSGSPGLGRAIERFASGQVDAHALVAGTVGLDRVGDVLSGWRPAGAGPGPKVHIDPGA